jgi:hemin uptake protein HemP
MSSPKDKDQGGLAEDKPAIGPSGRTVIIMGDRIESRDLFVGTREIIVGHGSESYRLRLTAQNKLILTK